ncbi:hypothetical protein HAX54_043520 [Datura stramonium]|uniref:Uncharacterized protein n=1 Tax=Datura stramonium TaxID=4076 RepID=A0ABS8SN84_DATST|nr:hypothetical protein [Datura stramonium]
MIRSLISCSMTDVAPLAEKAHRVHRAKVQCPDNVGHMRFWRALIASTSLRLFSVTVFVTLASRRKSENGNVRCNLMGKLKAWSLMDQSIWEAMSFLAANLKTSVNSSTWAARGLQCTELVSHRRNFRREDVSPAADIYDQTNKSIATQSAARLISSQDFEQHYGEKWGEKVKKLQQAFKEAWFPVAVCQKKKECFPSFMQLDAKSPSDHIVQSRGDCARPDSVQQRCITEHVNLKRKVDSGPSVSVSTFERICRERGISRCPSTKNIR